MEGLERGRSNYNRKLLSLPCFRHERLDVDQHLLGVLCGRLDGIAASLEDGGHRTRRAHFQRSRESSAATGRARTTEPAPLREVGPINHGVVEFAGSLAREEIV